VKENFLRALSFAGPDHVPYEGVVQIVRYADDMMWPGSSGVDAWGVGWESVQGEFVPMAKFHPFTDWDKAESFPLPDPANFRLHPEGERVLKEANREEVLLVSFQPHLFERACYLAGMERILTGVRPRNPVRTTVGCHWYRSQLVERGGSGATSSLSARLAAESPQATLARRHSRATGPWLPRHS